jgi:hypothetical protein
MFRISSVPCAIAMVAMLGTPSIVHADPIATAVSKLSDADIHRALERSASSHQGLGVYRQSVLKGIAKRTAKGAAIGFFSGLIAGALLNRHCRDEGGSCDGIVLKMSAGGAGTGAFLGVIGAFGP